MRGVDRQVEKHIEKCFISERYEILSTLGAGGSGTVYLAEHRRLKVLRAVKCISKTSSMHPSPFLEASLLKNLKHPGIPIIYDIEEDSSCYYIIEEYIQGVPLSYFCSGKHALPLEDILNYGVQLCGILEYLHDQKPNPVVYLDLKPEHIILCGNQIKIVDFGQAAYVPSNGKVRQIFITPEYAAPEQRKKAQAGIASDIYGFGAVLYSLIFHHRYSIGKKDKIPKKNKKLKLVVSVLERCLAQQEEERFASIDEVNIVLQALQREHPVPKQKYIGSWYGQKAYRHLYSKIVLLGNCPHVGTTYLGISIVSYLNGDGKDTAVYVEKNDSGFLAEYSTWNPRFCYSQGGYSFKEFRGIPDYGKDNGKFTGHRLLQVEDYGCEKEALVRTLTEDSGNIKGQVLVVFVVGPDCWKWRQAVQAAEWLERTLQNSCQWNGRLTLRYVLNKADPAQAAQLARYSGRRILLFPDGNNPFKMDRKKKRTLEYILRKGGERD